MIVQAGFYISSGGFGANFKSSRVRLLGDVFQLCKNAFCNPDEGPEFEMKAVLFPPVFLLKANGFASLLGIKMGVRVLISWTGLINFKAEFNALPIEIKIGDWTVFKLSAASGPISGRRLLRSASDTPAEETDADASDVEDIEAAHRADAAASTGWANAKPPSWGAPANAAPATAAPTAATVGSAKVVEDLVATGGPYALFDSSAGLIKVSGLIEFLGNREQIIIEANSSHFYMQRGFLFFGMPFTTTVVASVSFAQGGNPFGFKITMLAGSEETGIKNVLRTKVYQRLEEIKQQGEAVIKKAQQDLMDAKKKFDAAGDELRRHQADVTAQQAKISRACDNLEELTSEELLALQLEAKQGEQWGSVGKFVKKNVADPVKNHVVDPVKKHVVDPAAEAIKKAEILKTMCLGATKAANGILEGYKSAVGTAEKLVRESKVIMDAANEALKVVLKANTAAFALMQSVAGYLLAIDYVKLEGELKKDVLQSSLSATVQFTIQGKIYGPYSASINLGDLGSIVKSIFEQCLDFLKKKFPLPSTPHNAARIVCSSGQPIIHVVGCAGEEELELMTETELLQLVQV